MSQIRYGIVTQAHRRQGTGSSTAALAKAALERGHFVSILDSETAFLVAGSNVTFASFEVAFGDDWQGLKLRPERSRRAPSDCDVLLLRHQPPFDIAYAALLQILSVSRLPAVVVNRPEGVLLANEKIWLTSRSLYPPTAIGCDQAKLAEFAQHFDEVVVKPVDRFQAQLVRKFAGGSPELDVDLGTRLDAGERPVVVQKFLPQVASGDRRLFILDRQPVGAFIRIPKPGSFVASTHAGGTPAPAALDEFDARVARELGPSLLALGCVFFAVDIIGGFVTEIGVTSPTGFVQTKEQSGYSVATAICDWADAQLTGAG